MAEIIIKESDLDFVLDPQRTFRPEDEPFYKRFEGVAICDFFVLGSNDSLLLIEVKSSSPRDVQEFVQEIKRKFVDSILVYVASWANRTNTRASQLPDLLKQPDSLQRRMRLVLIVKDHKPDWLGPLREALRKECRSLEKLFSLEETQVYNQDLARRKLKLTINEV